MNRAYINGIILDGTKDMTPKKNLVVLTKDDKIEKIVPAGADISDYEEVNLHGQYLMPGLINMHIHLPSEGRASMKQHDNVKLVKLVTSNKLFMSVLQKVLEGFVKTEVLSGCTTVRTVGGVANIDSRIRDRVNSGKILGPRILAANMAVSVPNGHMAGSLAYPAKDSPALPAPERCADRRKTSAAEQSAGYRPKGR